MGERLGKSNPAATRTYSYAYAANGQDVVERRGPGNVLLATYGYNTRHQMTNEVLWPDSTTSYTNTWSFDAQGRLESKTTAAGQTTSYTYNGSFDLLERFHCREGVHRHTRYGTITRRRERWRENVAGRWPMSSPSASSGVREGLERVSESAWKTSVTPAGGLG